MSRLIEVSLGLTVNPKQFHAFRVDVKITKEIPDNIEGSLVQTYIDDVRSSELSSALANAVVEEVDKLYGKGIGSAMLPAYGFKERK